MLENVKLIIWDLDDTLWEGTISEGKIYPIKNRIDFIIKSTDHGIVHSVCSKNDYKIVKKKLEQLGIWEYFVFPSIDWTPKGRRIEKIIKDMSLRNENVLFVDDDETNLAEGGYYSNGLVLLKPEGLDRIIESEMKDLKGIDKQHQRLNNYKLLERKQKDMVQISNEEFLFASNIRVECREDCRAQLDRICELVQRTNQLNYTKVRSDKDEIEKLIDDKDCITGYVEVADNYGYYGIVGFYAVKENAAIHFLFSCRCLGMGVEQYVYYRLGCPSLKVNGQVAVGLETDICPEWINQQYSEKRQVDNYLSGGTRRILLKGPCDLSQMLPFFKDEKMIKTEFSYTNDKGVLIEGHNHTAQIVTAMKILDKRKKELVAEFPFWDHAMFETDIENEYDFVVLSLLPEANLGVYRHRGGNECIAVCEAYYDITNPKWNSEYIAGNIFTSGISFDQQVLQQFAEIYEYLDYGIEDTINNLTYIREHIKGKLILMLGSEYPFKHKGREAYKDRYLQHKELNRAIREWASQIPDVILISYDDYVTGESDFTDTINHFTKVVYYRVAQELVDIFNRYNVNVKIAGRVCLAKENIKVLLQRMPFFVNCYKYFKHMKMFCIQKHRVFKGKKTNQGDKNK